MQTKPITLQAIGILPEHHPSLKQLPPIGRAAKTQIALFLMYAVPTTASQAHRPFNCKFFLAIESINFILGIIVLPKAPLG